MSRLALLWITIVIAAGSPLSGQGFPGSDGRTEASPELLRAIGLYTGTVGRVDDDEARSIVYALAGEERLLAKMWVARILSTGRMGVQADRERAASIAAELLPALVRSAALGDVEALFLMGTVHAEGLGAEVNHSEALRWYRRAAAHGHVLAAHNIGNAYRDGRGVEATPEVAISWWLRAAHAGDVIPALRLGEAYEAGLGTPRDGDRARHWYSVAARAGNADAARALERLGG